MDNNIKNYIVLDIESTGLYYEAWDEPIEICAIKYINDEKTDVFHEYLKPFKSVPKKIEQLTGITNEFLENKETKYKILPRFRKFVGDFVVVAHNADFDIPFLNYWCLQLKLPLMNTRICTMKTFKSNTGSKKGNLAFAIDYFSIINNQAHSAIDDTEATSELFRFMKKINYNMISVENSPRDSYVEIMKKSR